MSGHAISRGGLLLIGFLLGACSVAEAKIPPARADVSTVPNVAGSDALRQYLAESMAPPVQQPVVTKTITLNFGPLHFQEILQSAPKSCRT